MQICEGAILSICCVELRFLEMQERCRTALLLVPQVLQALHKYAVVHHTAFALPSFSTPPISSLGCRVPWWCDRIWFVLRLAAITFPGGLQTDV